MKIIPHKVNFKHCGAWYELDDGRGIYLAHRQKRHIVYKKNAWAIERIALEMTREKGYEAAGVVVKEGKKRLVWLTTIDDFFGEHSFSNSENILQRCLPLQRFRVTPDMIGENVNSAMNLR
jgi:hypothetical protein